MLAVINIVTVVPLYSPSFVVQDYSADASPAVPGGPRLSPSSWTRRHSRLAELACTPGTASNRFPQIGLLEVTRAADPSAW
jgi:hypothetical protein